MAAVSAAAAPATTFARTSTPRASAAASAVGLPRLACKGGRRARGRSMAARPRGTATAGVASVLTMTVSAGRAGAGALVDERLTTEGTGLSLGISNNLLAWILLGVFGLIWALYFVYASTLEEDDDSALSL